MSDTPVDRPIDERSEAAFALRAALRASVLVLVGSALWHLPVETLWLRVPIAVVVAFVFLYALFGLLIAARVGRDMVGRARGWHRRPTAVRLLGAAFVAAALCLGTALFVLAGWLVDG